MIALTLFYLLFLILLILLIFLILLYSGYHNRTIAPPLLDTFYGINGESGNNIPASSSSYQTLTLTDGADTRYSAGVSGSLDFGASGATSQIFAFRPMWEDSQRKLRGNITLLINKQTTSTSDLNLRIIDAGDSNKVVGDATNFSIKAYDQGLGEIKLYFTSNTLSGSNYHHFKLQGRGTSGTSIAPNQILLNSAYMYYY
jgi:hypothetical protein